MMQKKEERPNCRRCVFYYITYNPEQPNGCQAMGFKSKQNPALVVYASSGMECTLFREKSSDKSQKHNGGSSRGGLVA